MSNCDLTTLQKIVKGATVVPAVNQVSPGLPTQTLIILRADVQYSYGTPPRQIEFSPYNYAKNKELLAYARATGIVIEAYSSLRCVLRFCHRHRQFLPISDYLNSYSLGSPITRYPGGPVDEPVRVAAERLGASPTQVILAWVRSKGVVVVTYVAFVLYILG